MSLDIIKPLGDDTWETVGQRLRDLRGCSHRLLNAGIRAAAIGDQANKDVMASARAGVKGALSAEREYWRDKIGKTYEGRNHDPKRAERLAELALPSVIEDHTASRAGKSFIDARKHMARGDKSLPSYKGGAPIFLRDGATSWKLEKAEQGWELALKLHPGRVPMVRFAVRVHSASAYADLRRMVSGDAGVKLGDARIVWHERSGKSQWEARLCYSCPKPEPRSGEHVVAVHRGMHRFVTIADTRPSITEVPGKAYLAAKLGFSARRRNLSEHIRKGELGHGARGRGVRRRYQALTRLDDAEARMLKTACQQTAALVANRAIAVGAAVVLIEDYQTLGENDSGEKRRFVPRWPWAQLKSAIAWACDKNGLTLREVPSAYISMTCPACEHVDAGNVTMGKAGSPSEPRRGEVFECTSCGFDWHIDAVAAFNMLRVSGEVDPVRKMQQALLRLGKRNREAAE